MTVALIANDTTYVYNLRLEVINELQRNGHRVVVICECADLVDRLEQAGVEIVDCAVSRHSKNPLKNLKLISFYKKVLKDIRPDVALTFNIKPNIYAGFACHKLNIPFLPNITGLGTAVVYPGLMQKLTVMLYRMTLKNASCVFFQNSQNKQFFEDMKIRCRESVLLPGSGVSLSKFDLLDYPDESNGIHFLFIARILLEKGIEEYLDAAKSIHEKYPDTHFHILGLFDGQNYRDKIEQYEKAGYIEYHGQQKDVIPFQKISHCTVLPSYFEGMSNVLLESAASGKPLITTDINGCKEAVDDGVNGFICKPRDSADLIRCIERFLSLSHEERRQMGIKGREKMEREFDRRIVVEKYMEQINKAINKDLQQKR